VREGPTSRGEQEGTEKVQAKKNHMVWKERILVVHTQFEALSLEKSLMGGVGSGSNQGEKKERTPLSVWGS